MKKLIGDMKLLELNEELVTFKGSKIVEIDLRFIDGQLYVKGTRKLNKSKVEFERLLVIEDIQEMTVKEFHDFLVR